MDEPNVYQDKAIVEQLEMIRNSGEISFKDQPNGMCFACKWNRSYKNDFMIDCGVPLIYLWNPVCISKHQMVHLSNIELVLKNPNQEWRNED